MSGMITPGVTPFDRSEFITDERFNLMVAELAAKIAAEGGGSELIGDLANLTTEAKANLVAAINELDSEIGDLSGLTTTAKNTIIGAINEVDSAIGKIATDRGYLSSKRITTQLELDNALNGKYYVEPIGTMGAGWLDVTTRHELENDYKIQRFQELNKGEKYRTCFAGTWSAWQEISKVSSFTPASQTLVVGSGFEAQTGASPFNVTKSGQMLYFIGQLKCLANTSASPVVLATSPLIPRGYFGLNILVNGVRQEGLTIAPGTGQIYIYKPFSANDIITFNGFAIGDI